MLNEVKVGSFITTQYLFALNNIFIFFVFAIILTALLFIIAYLLSFVFEQNREKISEYECGFEPFDNATRQTFDVQFYIVGILFLIFDVEIALFFPWSSYIEHLSIFGYYVMVLFLFIITLGFFYEWHIGALSWPKNKNALISNNLLFLTLNLYVYSNELLLITLISVLLIVIALNHSVAINQNSVLKNKISYILLVVSIYAIYICLYTSYIFISKQLKYKYLTDFYGFLSFYMINDVYTSVLKFIIFISTVLILFLSYRFLYNKNQSIFEYSVLILFTMFFLLILLSSSNLITVFISILGFSLNVYILLITDIENYACREASIKYFFLSATASAFTSLGIVFAYFLFKSTNYIMIHNILQEWSVINNQIINMFIIKFMLVTILLGSMLKLAAVPCHLWAPDVYSGSPHIITFLFVVPIKVAVFGFFIRLLTFTFSDLFHIWHYIIYVSAIASLIYGAVLAYDEKQIKRFWAYSSINQMGLLFIGLTTGSVNGIHASLLFLFIYVITNCIFFIIFLTTNNRNNTLIFLTDFTMFVKNNGIYAVLLTFVFFSLAGIPPFAGFFVKYFLLVHAVDSSLYILSIIVLLTNLISTYYYFRFIKLLWFDNIKSFYNSKIIYTNNNEFGLSIVLITYSTILASFIFILPYILTFVQTVGLNCVTYF